MHDNGVSDGGSHCLVTEQAWNDFGHFLNVGFSEFFVFMQAMAKAGNYILLLTIMTVTTASLYDASANRQLEQMKKLVDILHEN